MTRFDPKFREAFSDREESVFEMVGQSFRGRARWLTIISWAKMMMFVALGFVAAIEFFRVSESRWMIAWASIFVVSSLGTSMMFVLYWLELNRNAVTRELKRLELRIVEMSK